MGRETKMRLNEGDTYTDMKKWGNKMNEEEYKKGTSDNPETGENKKYIGLEDFPDTNIIGAGGEEDKESGAVFEVKKPIEWESDVVSKTKEAWKGKKAVPGAGKTVSSEQDFSDYDLLANAPKSVENILVSGGGSKTRSKEFFETGKNQKFGNDRARQPFDKGQKGMEKEGIKDRLKKLFGKN